MSLENMRAFIIKFVFYCILIGLFFVAFQYVFPVLAPFIGGFLIAFFLKPFINHISDKTGKKRRIIAVITLIVFYLLIVTLFIVLGSRLVIMVRDGFYLLPSLYTDLIEPAVLKLQDIFEGLVVQLSPALLSTVETWGESLTTTLSNLVATISQVALTAVTNFASRLPSFFIKLAMMIIASFFFVVDYYKITSFIVSHLPPSGRELLFKIKQNGIEVLFKFAKAYALLLSITFIEVFIGLSLLHVEYALLIALVVAAVDILPVLGTGTILLPWGLANVLLGDYPLGIGILVLYVIITVVRQGLEPRIVGKQIGLYPLVTLICMFVGSYLFGFVGLLGLPILVTIIMQLIRNNDIPLAH